MTADIRVFGIRHHGPGSARSLRAALDEYAPDAVVIEGPADADALIPLAAHPDMRPPVALLAYDTAEPGRAAFWPFAAFSPEWQALAWAAEHGVPARFCDLPAANSLVGKRERSSGDPLEDLARAAGFDDAERWWDAVVESTSDAATFEAILDAMTELRAPLERGTDQNSIREAYMRQTIRKLAKTAARIAVVCGAYHAPALTTLGPAAPDLAVLRGLPKVKTSLTWVPWTHSRLATASGYGAGITSPGWYHHLHTEPEQPIARWLTKVARVLRAEDLPVSSAHVIEAVRLAETLAAMRSRPLAGLSEVTEATRAVLCDGNDVRLRLVTERLVVGQDLGAVPDETPTIPVDADLRATARRLRLKQQALIKTLNLDLRKPNDRAKSRLLHRLSILGIDWGTATDSQVQATGTFRETWTLEWQPEFAVAIVEASMWGTTVPGAATAKLLDGLAQRTLGELARLLDRALLADLPVPELLSALEAAAALDHDVAHLLGAIGPLTRTIRYRDVRGTDTAALEHVTDSMLVRISAGFAAATTGLDDDSAADMRTLVDEAHTAIMTRDDAPATARWLGTLQSVSGRDDVHGVLAGRLVRLLRDAGTISESDSAARLSRALSVGPSPAAKAAWIDGFLGGGGLLLVHDRDLLALLDHWVSGLDDADFTAVLPLLRRTFGGFEEPERRAVGRAVRGEARTATSAPVDTERGRIAQRTVLEILG